MPPPTQLKGSIPACAGEPSLAPRRSRLPRVYPRVCGGTTGAWPRNFLASGLSPRVRGNRVCERLKGAPFGSIPACAGEPTPRRRGFRRARVYPRVCGGTSANARLVSISPGLSPRVRGNPRAPARRRVGRGSIPACAGEPGASSASGLRGGVYPRVCGGTTAPRSRLRDALGLSPRVRGNRTRLRGRRPRDGSIPACAGEPRRNRRGGVESRVYPRVCGGTATTGTTSAASRGLSPRVRGNPFQVEEIPLAVGSIPACAGEPPPSAQARTLRRVYPRVCGGTPPRMDGAVEQAGLSPRVRGNREDHHQAPPRRGSIPACAGEPSASAPVSRGVRVYPRVCGGTRTLHTAAFRVKGLSPRVRGNPATTAGAAYRAGSIPACAGEPRS